MVVGLLTTAMAYPLQMMYTFMEAQKKPVVTSRLPKIEPHEQLDFVFHCMRDDDMLDDHTTNLF